MRMFLVKWMSLAVNTVYLSLALSGRNGFLLQQKSSATGFHSKLWNNDMGDDLSRALAQYSMYPLIFLAVPLHDRQSCYCGTPASVLSIKHTDHNESGFTNTELEQNATLGLNTAKLLSFLPPRNLLRVSSSFEYMFITCTL